MTLREESLLAQWSSPEIVLAKLSGVNTLEKVFQADTPTLAALKRTSGTENAKAWIEAWIILISDFLNIGRPMNSTQIQITADLILERFFALTVADVHLVFRKAMAGDFGTLYNRLDGSIILKWFKEYFDQRCELAEALSQAENQARKNPQHCQIDLQLLQPFLTKIAAQIPDSKPNRKNFRQQIREAQLRYMQEKQTLSNVPQVEPKP